MNEALYGEFIERALKARDEARFDDVLALCAEADENGVRSPRLLSAKAAALAGLGRTSEALSLLEEALGGYPTDPGVHYSMAVTCMRAKGMRRRARTEAEAALRLMYQGATGGMDEESLAVAASGSMLVLKMFRETIPYLEDCLKLWPDSAALHYHLGYAYAASGRWFKARKAAEPATLEQRRSLSRVILASVLVYAAFFIVIVGLFVLSLLSSYALFIFIAVVVALLVTGTILRLRR